MTSVTTDPRASQLKSHTTGARIIAVALTSLILVVAVVALFTWRVSHATGALVVDQREVAVLEFTTNAGRGRLAVEERTLRGSSSTYVRPFLVLELDLVESRSIELVVTPDGAGVRSRTLALTPSTHGAVALEAEISGVTSASTYRAAVVLSGGAVSETSASIILKVREYGTDKRVEVSGCSSSSTSAVVGCSARLP